MSPRRAHMDPALREHFVYRAYDTEGRLLYVGCTMHLDKRWSEHRHSALSGWTDYAVGFKLAGPYNYDTARALEKTAIRTEAPWFNFGMGDLRLRRQRQLVMARIIDQREAETGQEWWNFLDEAVALADIECPVPTALDTYLALLAQSERVSA